jgi:hypothetical protein
MYVILSCSNGTQFLIQQEVVGRTNNPLSFDTTWTTWKMTPLTMLHWHGKVFKEILPSNNWGHTVRLTNSGLTG